MSVIVRGIDMPQKCGQCPCFNPYEYKCQAIKQPSENRHVVAPYGLKPKWCPLFEVKDWREI